jgi:hypothetical protein
MNRRKRRRPLSVAEDGDRTVPTLVAPRTVGALTQVFADALQTHLLQALCDVVAHLGTVVLLELRLGGFQRTGRVEVRDHIAQGLEKMRLKRICEDLCQRPDRPRCHKCGHRAVAILSYREGPPPLPPIHGIPRPGSMYFESQCGMCYNRLDFCVGRDELLTATAITIVNFR